MQQTHVFGCLLLLFIAFLSFGSLYNWFNEFLSLFCSVLVLSSVPINKERVNHPSRCCSITFVDLLRYLIIVHTTTVLQLLVVHSIESFEADLCCSELGQKIV